MEEQKILELFSEFAKTKADSIDALPGSGSDRRYYRIKTQNQTFIGVYNPDIRENEAFFSFTNSFNNLSLPVPKLLHINKERTHYLLNDLGDTTLYAYLQQKRSSEVFPDEISGLYKKVVSRLPEFQIKAAAVIDYEKCYPRGAFDKQSMMWDLNYFKYYFLKLSKIPYNEQYLEDDFQSFTQYLLQADNTYFLYRDFQSRNIMLHDEQLYFIDYQGGRKGPLQYDIASLLYDAKADIPVSVRASLFEHYMDAVSEMTAIDRKSFTEYYHAYVLIRIMQAMGAYGFRGFYEKKEHFLQSIPYALGNIEYLLGTMSLSVKIPHLLDVLKQLTGSERLREIARPVLNISINSFSYKRGIPVDESGNGGGFVFDCRAIPNPGKYEEYKTKTGLDPEVISFLEKEPIVPEWFSHVSAIVTHSVERYLNRGFTNLMLNFGCTGGQHRSVYFAEKTAAYIRQKYNVHVRVKHREQDMRSLNKPGI